MRVKDVQTETVAMCRLDTNLAEATKRMWETGGDTLAVLDDKGKLAGMLSDRQICLSIVASGVPPSEIYASQVMDTLVATCKSSDHIRGALGIMRDGKIRLLPVLSDTGAFEGLLSVEDIVCNIRRDYGNADAISYGEMITALQTIFTRDERFNSQSAAA